MYYLLYICLICIHHLLHSAFQYFLPPDEILKSGVGIPFWAPLFQHERLYRSIPLTHPAAARRDMVLLQAFRARRVRRNGIGGEVRYGVTSGISRETSLNDAFARSSNQQTSIQPIIMPTQQKENREAWGSTHVRIDCYLLLWYLRNIHLLIMSTDSCLLEGPALCVTSPSRLAFASLSRTSEVSSYRCL